VFFYGQRTGKYFWQKVLNGFSTFPSFLLNPFSKMARLHNLPNSFLALDPPEAGAGNKLPLWLFGFLY